jgi:hypothetical protein
MEYLSKYMIPDISNLVIEYCLEYKLLNWVEKNKINWDNLSHNKKSIKLLKANPDKINWSVLSYNTYIFYLG